MSKVRDAFLEQARWCTQLGSPFTAQVCSTLAEKLDDGTEIGAAILNWQQDPSANSTSLPLRVTGALHALARDGRHAELTALYPPAPLPSPAALWKVIEQLFAKEPAHFREYLASAPQTNEVGRSAVLMPGLLFIAERVRRPLHLLEIGASAGLNLILDRYHYRFGSAEWGPQDSAVLLEPQWRGPTPPVGAPVQIASRRGVDLNPLDLHVEAERNRLLSYVWADQTERLRRLEAAIQTALTDAPIVERMEAADWVEQRLDVEGKDGTAQVLMHSIVWSYLPSSSQQRINAHLARAAKNATSERPLAWLRFELNEPPQHPSLTVTIWPEGTEHTLATAHAHGAWVNFDGGK